MGAGKTTVEAPADPAFKLALAVTGCPEDAAAAVSAARSATGGRHSPSGAALLAQVLSEAEHRAGAATTLPSDLLDSGDATPDALARVSRSALETLAPRERGIFELAVRQGVDGPRLAEVLGIHPGQAATASRTTMERAERLVGAVLLCRLGRQDCLALAELVEGLGPHPDAQSLADEVGAHETGCAVCTDRRRALVPAASLLGPPGPRSRSAARWRRSRSRRLPVVAGSRRAWLAAGAAILLAATTAVGVALTDDDDAGVGAPSRTGQLVVAATELPLGTDGETGLVEVTNAGPSELRIRAQPDVTWLQVSPAVLAVPPGGRATLRARIDRSVAPEGEATGQIRLSGSGGAATVAVSAGVERAPVLSGLTTTPERVVHQGCAGYTPSEVRASVVEESGLHVVELHWRGGDGVEQSSVMTEESGSHRADLGPFQAAGDITWWVVAVDIRENRTISQTAVLPVGGC